MSDESKEEDDRARRPELSCLQLIESVLSEVSDDILAITIVVMEADGVHCRLYSNARSEPEMNGMLHDALGFQSQITLDVDNSDD